MPINRRRLSDAVSRRWGYFFGMTAVYTPEASRAASPSSGTGLTGDGVGEALLALVFLIVAAPMMLLAALAIYVEDGGPVFFIQTRLGKGGREFPCVKLRTMCVDAQDKLEALLANDPGARAEWAESQKLRRDPRITFTGSFLRGFSIDELPQFLNVVAGHMSVVGPRPIVPAEVCRYGRRFAAYCAVRPGMTGLWQVRGRSNTSYRSRVAMDVVYSRNRSLLFDLEILAATFPAVINRKGSC